MAVNKAETPAWMRIVIIMVVISFTGAGIAIVAAGIGGGGSGSAASGGDTITSQFQPRVDAALTAMKASPDNPDIIAQVGHAYFEWAVALYESGQQGASIPFWLSSVTYYDQVLAINPDDDVVLGNKAFALYYGQSADAPVALRAFIDGAQDNAQLSAQVENARGMLAEIEAAPSAPTTTAP
jgi:hypothetical protein